MSQETPETDSLVIFRNSQGEEGRGTLIHLTRNLAVFEVYNPYSIVQLSEVVEELRVRRRNRTVYQGRAVVSNIVSTGLMVIVSATLVDQWSDLAGLEPGPALRSEVSDFVEDWDSTYALRPHYQVAVTNLSAFLSELSPWLQQAETAVGVDPEENPELEREFLDDVAISLAGKITNLFQEFEHEAHKVPPEEAVTHKAFARRELHPYLMCAPFVHRTYSKPLGYAGDYEMVNMILRNVPEGPNTYAKLVHQVTVGMDAAEAHRNRIEFLRRWLREETERCAARGERLKVLNVGCGPAGEIQKFIKADPICERCQIDLLDFNKETLEYTRARIDAAANEAGRKPEVNYVHKSVNKLLKEAVKMKREAPRSDYDFVYCAGLFDYLTDRVCSRLLNLFHAWTKPRGLIVATNVHPNNPGRYYMEHLLEWNLTYRNEDDMKKLAPEGSPLELVMDETGVNVLLRIRKEGT
jgi:extracellular factor (EF) 3-hydroxypalmitic acid methyl ester biosynthesis protein